ncbi:MAG: PhoH family protein [Lentisphaeria bacterium]
MEKGTGFVRKLQVRRIMRKNFILDTNVLLHNPMAIYSFPENNVIIPIQVIEEVDKFKRNMTELGRNSRTFAKVLDELRAEGRLGEGISLNNGSVLRVICSSTDTDLEAMGLQSGNRADDKILALAVHLHDRFPDENTIVVTKNVNLRLKADALGVPSEDYETDRSPDADVYTGWFEVDGAAEQVAALNRGETIEIDKPDAIANQYILLRDSKEAKNTALGRLPENDSGKLVPLPNYAEGAVGIFPLNVEQTFAMEALLNEDIELVTMTGKAGTGKTLLAIAAGLRKVFKEDHYNRLLVFRPTTPVGKDLGYLPGDVGEKMRPWMQPVYDALELIREEDRRSRQRSLPPDIMECEEISIEPLTYIRGRSIPHQYIIIDEAQNLTPLEVKTVITRVGRGTKLVMTGDPHQIDNPYVDSLSNGLVFLLDRFRRSPMAAHIGLSRGERSQLAEYAADIL